MDDSDRRSSPRIDRDEGLRCWVASLLRPRHFLELVGSSLSRPDIFVVLDICHQKLLDLWILGHLSADGMVQGRFLDLVQTVARLWHPNLLPICDAGGHEGRLFLLQPHVEGRSLKDRRAAGPFSVAEAVELVIVLARTVHFMHREGFEGLDLTTAGVLIPHDRPCMIDLRRTLDRRFQSGEENEGWFVHGGITGCEAPEVMRGPVSEPGRAADIYALGAILYEMLTGRPAVIRGAAGVTAIRNILELEPERPRSLNPLVDRALESICLRCLRKDPARRYDSAESLVNTLEGWQADRRRSPIGRLWRRWMGPPRRRSALPGEARPSA